MQQQPDSSPAVPPDQEPTQPSKGLASAAKSDTLTGDAPLGSTTLAQPQAPPEVVNGESSNDSTQAPASEPSVLGAELTPVLDLMRMQDGQIFVALFQSSRTLTLRPVIEYGGRRNYVPRLPRALSRSLLLPTTVKPYVSTRELFNSICTLLREHALLDGRQRRLVTYWVMASWFPDFLSFIPPLVVTGPALAADLLLGALRYVCRRPVPLAGLTPAILSAIPFDELAPTLLIREPQLNKRMAGLLDASNRPGYFVASGKDMVPFYCAKCIYLGEDVDEQRLTAHGIHVHLTRNRTGPILTSPQKDVVQDLQNRLFYYRLQNHDKVASSKFMLGQLLPEFSTVAQTLGAAVVDDAALQRTILELLREPDEQARVDHGRARNARVLRAVLSYCHEHERQRVLVNEIADAVNQTYQSEGEPLKISAEAVGHVLKNLGLYTQRLGNEGRGLVLDQPKRQRVHEIADQMQVLDPDEPPQCGHCQKLQLSESEQFV
jgi:hypothetical protein